MKKKIFMLVLCLLVICLPAFAAKKADKNSNVMQIVQYPVVESAITVPSNWTADIDDNNVLLAQKDEVTCVFMIANAQKVPFDTLAQLTDSGKINFSRQMKTEAADGRKNFQLGKEEFREQNGRAVYDLQYNYYDEDLKRDIYCHSLFVVKNNQLLRIVGLCPVVIADIAEMDTIITEAGF